MHLHSENIHCFHLNPCYDLYVELCIIRYRSCITYLHCRCMLCAVVICIRTEQAILKSGQIQSEQISPFWNDGNVKKNNSIYNACLNASSVWISVVLRYVCIMRSGRIGSVRSSVVAYRFTTHIWNYISSFKKYSIKV